MEHTPKLALPYIIAAQAQKHVTHNEALRRLDQIIHLSLVSATPISEPPLNPGEGEAFLVASGAAGSWSGKEGDIAVYHEESWFFFTPQPGWIAWIEDESEARIFDGSAFVPMVGNASEAPLLGVNASADTDNRLSVSSPGSLFSHEGSDHRVLLNRATADDTASIIFQTDFSGETEVGLSGTDGFSIKVANGSAWQAALTVGSDGSVGFPNGLALTGEKTLDRYESGSWVPQFSATGGGVQPDFNVQEGDYLRIGQLIFLSGRLGWTTPGALSGQLRITQLPFVCASGLQNRAAVTVGWYDGLALPTNATQFGGFVEAGTDIIRLWGAVNAHEGINVMMQGGHLSTNGTIYFSVMYRTSD